MTDPFMAALAIVSGLSGLGLAWLNYRRDTTTGILKATSELVDDFDKVRKALTEENERLAKQLEHLRKELLQETHKRLALEERLNIERDVFSRRITTLERRIKELTAAVANNHTTTDHK